MNRRAITTFCATSTALFLLLIGILHSIVNVSGLRRAIERGEIPASTDVEAAMDLLSGPVMFRYLVTHAPVDADFLRCVRDIVVDGLERGHCR